jgi:hypothetical protein
MATKCAATALFLWLFCGCGGQATTRMARPEDPQGPYRQQIEVAQRVLQQNENWADRAEWEVSTTAEGWTLIAWRVEHPDETGPSRYLPWGYSVIELDRRMVAVRYERKG